MFTNWGKDGKQGSGPGPGATQRHTPQEHTALTDARQPRHTGTARRRHGDTHGGLEDGAM